MAFTLLDAAQNSQSNLKRGIIADILETSPFLSTIPFITAASLRYEFSREGALPDTEFRGLNEAFTASEGKFLRNILQLMPIGTQIDLDRKLVNIDSFAGDDQQARQLFMALRAVSLDWKKNLFNGNNTINEKEPDGLKQILNWATAVFRMSTRPGQQVSGTHVEDGSSPIEYLRAGLSEIPMMNK